MSSSTTRERAAESERLIVNDILPHLRGVRQGSARTHWTFYCPLNHRKKNASAAIWVDEEGWISVHCFDCQRNLELRDALVSPAVRGRKLDTAPRFPGNPKPEAQQRTRDNPAPIIWSKTESIAVGDNPARRWFQQRNLWRPDVTCPAPLRWLPAESAFPGPHVGAGSLVALLAPLKAWESAWPGLPRPWSVEIIAVDAAGRPSLDRPAEQGGLGKRTLGDKKGCVLLLGDPDPASQDHPARVAEGVADGLALAARFPGPAICTMGDAGMKTQEMAQWLARMRHGSVIHADNDLPGHDAANRLVLAVKGFGGNSRAVLSSVGKDVADTAAQQPFPIISETWPNFSDSLVEMYGWPRWEAQRQAAILMGEQQDL